MLHIKYKHATDYKPLIIDKLFKSQESLNGLA